MGNWGPILIKSSAVSLLNFSQWSQKWQRSKGIHTLHYLKFHKSLHHHSLFLSSFTEDWESLIYIVTDSDWQAPNKSYSIPLGRSSHFLFNFSKISNSDTIYFCSYVLELRTSINSNIAIIDNLLVYYTFNRGLHASQKFKPIDLDEIFVWLKHRCSRIDYPIASKRGGNLIYIDRPRETFLHKRGKLRECVPWPVSEDSLCIQLQNLASLQCWFAGEKVNIHKEF